MEKTIRDRSGNPVLKAIDPPESVCRKIIAATDWPAIPFIHGIVEAPTILRSGRIIQKRGYDKETGILFNPGTTKFPPIPEHPTPDDAREALEVLSDPFKDFPFVSDVDRSVILSSGLTVLTRKTLGNLAPLFGLSAPNRSCGKTLLAHCISMIASGRNATALEYTSDAAEESKRLFARLLEGASLVLIDNVETAMRSAALNVILTSPAYGGRVLGQSRTADVPTRCMFIASGNNLTFAGDLATRTLICRIDPKVEDADARQFDRDLYSWIPQHRGKLVAAALTIIKAFMEAGEPRPDVPNYGRFLDWQRMCRFPLIWLGLEDPCKSREIIKNNDPDASNFANLLSAWHVCFKDKPTTINQATRALYKRSDDGPIPVSDELQELIDAMDAVASHGGKLNPRTLGNFMRKHNGRIVSIPKTDETPGARYTLSDEGSAAGGLKWRVTKSELSELLELDPTHARKTTERVDVYARSAETNSSNSPNSSSQHPINGEERRNQRQERPCSLGATPSVKVPARGDKLVLVDRKGGRTRCRFVEVRDASVWRVELLEDCTVLAKRAGDVANVAVRDLHMPSNQPTGAL